MSKQGMKDSVTAPKVSVIVPVYNARAYIRDCLDSLLAQTLQDIEIICIDDGSTDSSASVLCKYAARDSRMVALSQTNAGYGATINKGISRARGRYVGIVEADDFVDAVCFEQLYATAEQHGFPDIVKANHYRYRDGKDALCENFPDRLCGQLLDVSQEAAHLVLTVPAVWAAMYRRDFLEEAHIRCRETPGAAFQDTGLVIKSWIAAKNVVLIHDAFLHYRYHDQGQSVAGTEHALSVCDEWHEIDAYVRAHPELNARYEIRAACLAAKCFQTYCWNLQRFGKAAPWRFVWQAACDYRALAYKGLLQKEYYSEGQWRMLQRWMRHPCLFFVLRKLRRGSRGLRSSKAD